MAVHLAKLGGMFTPFFTHDTVTNLDGAKACDADAHAALFHGMLERGYYLPPSQFETAFVSAAHSLADIEGFVAAAAEVLGESETSPFASDSTNAPVSPSSS